MQVGRSVDSSEHRIRMGVGWHDVCARIEVPAVADVADHFCMRWKEVTGQRLPPPSRFDSVGDVEVRDYWTVPEHVYGKYAEWRLPHLGVVLFVRSGRRSTLSTSRTSSGGRPRSRLRYPTSSAVLRATTFECSWYFRRNPTPARMTREASSVSWSLPTRALDDSLRARFTRGRTRGALRCTFTRRSESWTIAGSPSARRTSTSTRFAPDGTKSRDA